MKTKKLAIGITSTLLSIGILVGCNSAGQKNDVNSTTQNKKETTTGTNSTNDSSFFVERGLFPDNYEEKTVPVFYGDSSKPILYIDFPIYKNTPKDDDSKPFFIASYYDENNEEVRLTVDSKDYTLNDFYAGTKPIFYAGYSAVDTSVKGFENMGFKLGYFVELSSYGKTTRENNRKRAEEYAVKLTNGEVSSNPNINHKEFKVIDTEVNGKPAYIWCDGNGSNLTIDWNDKYQLNVRYVSSWGEYGADGYDSDKSYGMEAVEYFGKELAKRIKTEDEFTILEAKRQEMLKDIEKATT